MGVENLERQDFHTTFFSSNRRKIRSCNTVLSLPGSVDAEEKPAEEKPAEKPYASTPTFKKGGKINFDLHALKSRSDKPISNRLALLALTIDSDEASNQIPKVFYSTTFKMMNGSEESESASGEEEASRDKQGALPLTTSSRTRRSVVETFRETRVFKMDESRKNVLWLDITREIPRWKRAFHHPESVMEITITYFLPGGDAMSNAIRVSTEDASLVIFSKDDQKLEELQKESEESEKGSSEGELDEDANKVERRRRRRSLTGPGDIQSISSQAEQQPSSATLFRERKNKRRRNMRSSKRAGGKRRRANKRRRNKAAAAQRRAAEAARTAPRQIQKIPDVQATEAEKRKDGLCSLEPYIIDFETLGWDSWIIYPKKYDAFQCSGACPTPIDQSLNPTNHGMLHSLMKHKSGDKSGRDNLCCVPSKLSPLSMLYMENGLVVTRHHPDMIVDQCACR